MEFHDSKMDLTVDWLKNALTQGEISLALSDPADICEFSIEQIGSRTNLMGQLYRCRFASETDVQKKPSSVVIKLPARDALARWVAKKFSAYEREFYFYRDAAPCISVRTPKLLHGDFKRKGNRFVIVLEDLGAMKTYPEVPGADADQAAIAVRNLARIHGRFWNQENNSALKRIYGLSSLSYGFIERLMLQVCFMSVRRQFGHLFSDHSRRVAEAVFAELNSILAQLRAGPSTLVHGDYRLENMLFSDRADSDLPSFAILDWQGCGRGCGLYDIAYFFATSLEIETRRNIERNLLQEYWTGLLQEGVTDYSFDVCWQTYRMNLMTVLAIIIMIGGALGDSSDAELKQTKEVVLKRTLTAIEDHSVEELLPNGSGRDIERTVFSILARILHPIFRVCQNFLRKRWRY